jgi:D-arabinose 1-dehydrogenase-like Zn-dependent alcohol dehydrogenase
MDLLKSWKETFQNPVRDKYASRSKHVAYATVILSKQGLFPGIQYPKVPGHEVAGVIDEVGKDVTKWKRGQRVAVGWHGGHCGHCESCRRGDFVMCKYAQVPGISYDGGYSDYILVPTAWCTRSLRVNDEW